jgi:hypothetical protein
LNTMEGYFYDIELLIQTLHSVSYKITSPSDIILLISGRY